MSEVNDVRLVCAPEVTKHPNFQEEELRRLIVEVIKKSPIPSYYKTEVIGYNESPNLVKSTRVRAGKFDRATSRMPISVTLVGQHEKWLICVYPSKAAQENITSFATGFKNAAKMVEEEENEKLLAREAEAVQQSPTPNDSRDHPGNPDSGEKKRKSKSAPRRMTDVINEETIIVLLKFCLKMGGVQKVIDQSDLLPLIRSLNLDCNSLLVPSFLAKKGLFEIIRVPRKPQLKMTKQGCDLVHSFEQKELEFQAKQEEATRLQEMMQFIEGIRPLLATLRGMKSLSEEHDEIRQQIKEQQKINQNLAFQLQEGEKRLADLETSLKKKTSGIFTHLDRVNMGKLSLAVEKTIEHSQKR